MKNNFCRITVNLKRKIFVFLCGIIFCVIFLELAIRLSGKSFLFLQDYSNKTHIAKRGEYRILCLGESTTAFGGKGSFVSQLENILNMSRIGIHFRVINEGIVRANTNLILDKLPDNLNKYKPDMVVVMMGINEEGVKYYESIPDSDTKLFKEFKVYRLIRQIWVLLFNKEKKLRFLEERANEEYFSLLKAVKENPKDANAYVDLGFFYFNTARAMPQAEALFQKALKFSPSNDDAYRGLGTLRLYQKKYLEADAFFKRAIKLDSGDVRGYLNLAELYYNADGGDWRQKTEALLVKAEGVCLDINSYIELGRLYLGIKKYSKAENIFKKTLESGFDLDSKRLYNYIAKALELEGKIAEA